jgi:hypothetical protein
MLRHPSQEELSEVRSGLRAGSDRSGPLREALDRPEPMHQDFGSQNSQLVLLENRRTFNHP